MANLLARPTVSPSKSLPLWRRESDIRSTWARDLQGGRRPGPRGPETCREAGDQVEGEAPPLDAQLVLKLIGMRRAHLRVLQAPPRTPLKPPRSDHLVLLHLSHTDTMFAPGRALPPPRRSVSHREPAAAAAALPGSSSPRGFSASGAI
ncbi:hypothetical protein EYF80_002291 [Liparis tanakae]|uniref:Uncharacterized protein n=1 Tax=Liparis tanakae TaxID=230148 RepID=A0A4Z2JCL7_9TELE|nr:hypothetical protein EYF80_002291 [Liparis tanakae]